MNTRSNQQLVATSIEMDISPEEDDKLFNAVNRMLGDCHQVGRETQPEIYHFEKPCICTDYGKIIELTVDGHTLNTPKAIVYALIYRARPGFKSVISHQGGRGPKCIEPTHLNIVLMGENNQHRTCHRLIKEQVDKWEHPNSGKRTAEREGTIFYEGCRHTDHPCFKQYGTLNTDEEIWPYGRIVYDPGFGFSIAASDFEPISFSDSDWCTSWSDTFRIRVPFASLSTQQWQHEKTLTNNLLSC